MKGKSIWRLQQYEKNFDKVTRKKTKMMNWKTKRFERYVFEFLIAIELIMSFTFLGYIHVPPISIATAYIPIIITGSLFDPLKSGIAGLIFGLGSLYKASAAYVQASDQIFSPFRSGRPVESFLLSVGARVLFGLLIGGLFWLVKKRAHRRIWNGLIALLAPKLQAFLVFGAMGLFFPEHGYTAAAVLQIAKSDIFIALLCLFCVEVCDVIYHSRWARQLMEAMNQSQENLYWSSRIWVGILIITVFVISMAAISTVYFSDRVRYLLQEHGVNVTDVIYGDLVHMQVQFLIAMLALNFILILIIMMVYRYMKYREYLGAMDPLTGVMGRRMFQHHCEMVQESGKRDLPEKGWFLFLDVDWFKKINDSLGHLAGDETLHMVAQNLQRILGKYGAVGRVGGDEFAVMIEAPMTRAQLEEKLQQFQGDISAIRTEGKVSCSIGVYHFTFPQEIKHLLRETDNALYMAKERGRACFVVQEE